MQRLTLRDHVISMPIGHVVGHGRLAIGVHVAVAAVGHSVWSTGLVMELPVRTRRVTEVVRLLVKVRVVILLMTWVGDGHQILLGALLT